MKKVEIEESLRILFYTVIAEGITRKRGKEAFFIRCSALSLSYLTVKGMVLLPRHRVRGAVPAEEVVVFLLLVDGVLQVRNHLLVLKVVCREHLLHLKRGEARREGGKGGGRDGGA